VNPLSFNSIVVCKTLIFRIQATSYDYGHGAYAGDHPSRRSGLLQVSSHR